MLIDTYTGSSKQTRKLIVCGYCQIKVWAFKGSKYCSRQCAAYARKNTKTSNYLSKAQHNFTKNEYKRIHANLAKERGKAKSCINGCKATRYEWANQTGDYYNFNDYVAMCCSCHHKLDLAKERSAK